jgi:hypothetical protein
VTICPSLRNTAKVAPLGDHVRDIRLLCADKEVVWIHAVADIAGVANVQASRNLAVFKNPSNPVGKVTAPIKSEHSISIRDVCASPTPTITRLVNL